VGGRGQEREADTGVGSNKDYALNAKIAEKQK
jgi:hypothetical protein